METETDFEFPDDYARRGEAQAAADSINDVILGDFPPPVDPALPDSSEFEKNFFDKVFDNLKGWNLPPHFSQCPVGSFDAFSQSFTIDSHCQLAENYFGAFSGAMAVVWVVAALWVVLRA
jgi:hypothetical protein